MNRNAARNYIQRVYDSRYFWMQLARIELKNKFRRSKLGLMWTFVSPLCLTLIMSVVFATAFKSNIITYAPYVLSGIIFWDIVSISFIAGGTAIIACDAYIRQFNHPITIYTLKTAIVTILSFLIATISLAIWTLFVAPLNLLVALVTLPLTVIIYFIFSWSSVTIAAMTCTKYRDYPQMAQLVLQTFWYVSPVFMQESLFTSHPILYAWFSINPITHMLALIRAPFLYGQFPSLINYSVAILFVLVMALIAIHTNKKNARDIIFYI